MFAEIAIVVESENLAATSAAAIVRVNQPPQKSRSVRERSECNAAFHKTQAVSGAQGTKTGWTDHVPRMLRGKDVPVLRESNNQCVHRHIGIGIFTVFVRGATPAV